MVDFVSRAAWGARTPTGTYSLWHSGPTDLVVHYVGGSGDIGIHSHDDCPAVIRSVQAYEMSHGYIDIAYNLVLCPHGVVFVGRGTSIAGAANGPATNGSKMSVLYLSNGSPLTPQAEQTLRILHAQYGPQLLGHREVNSTNCPGDAIFAQVVAIRNSTTPSAPPAPSTGGAGALLVALRALARTFAVGPVLSKGSKGVAVRDLQFLIDALFSTEHLVADGDFGPATDAAVKRVQSFAHLGADGVVGPKTRGWLAAATRNKFG